MMKNMLVVSVFVVFHLPVAGDSLDCVKVKAYYEG